MKIFHPFKMNKHKNKQSKTVQKNFEQLKIQPGESIETTPNGSTTQIIVPHTKKQKFSKIALFGGGAVGIITGGVAVAIGMSLIPRPVAGAQGGSTQEFNTLLASLPKSEQDATSGSTNSTTVYNTKQELNVKSLLNWAQLFSLHSVNNELVKSNQNLENSVNDTINNYNRLATEINDKNNQIRQLAQVAEQWYQWWTTIGPILKQNKEVIDQEIKEKKLNFRLRPTPDAPTYSLDQLQKTYDSLNKSGNKFYIDSQSITPYKDWTKIFSTPQELNLPTVENGGIQPLEKVEDSAQSSAGTSSTDSSNTSQDSVSS